MKAILLPILKTLGSRVLMTLSEELVKVLRDRSDNTVDHTDVAKVQAIRATNMFYK